MTSHITYDVGSNDKIYFIVIVYYKKGGRKSTCPPQLLLNFTLDQYLLSTLKLPVW